MTSIKYECSISILNEEDVLGLYSDAAWGAYTRDMATLMKALPASLDVFSAWDNGRLVGLVRVVGDGLTIVYVQDLLVRSSHKRQGIGATLMHMVMDKYKNVRQKVLITEDEPESRGFYEAIGFTSCDKGTTVAFIKFN